VNSEPKATEEHDKRAREGKRSTKLGLGKTDGQKEEGRRHQGCRAQKGVKPRSTRTRRRGRKLGNQSCRVGDKEYGK